MISKENEIRLLRDALQKVTSIDVFTSYLDPNLNHKISPFLSEELNTIEATILKFQSSADFRQEKEILQLVAIRYRILIQRTLQELTEKNENPNKLSEDQFVFIQDLTRLGGKLQSYTQLLVTSANHAKIYNMLREAAILREISGEDALEYLRRNKNSGNDNPGRTDIKELVKTNKKFDEIYGIQKLISEIKQIIDNIRIGLVESFLFVIFYGAPGTGKTAVSEAVATHFSNGEYFKFDQSFFSSTYVGVAESRIRNIFETIRANPQKKYCIIIDEADNVLGNELAQNHLNSIKILLQTEISSYESFKPNVIIIAITNYWYKIDQTFLRRCTSLLKIPPPSNKECLEFLEKKLTFNEVRFKQEFREKLKFNNELVYTNSDMGRLAKNIRDSFLYSLYPDQEIKIIVFERAKIIIFCSATDISSQPVIDEQFISYQTRGDYLTVMKQLTDILDKANSNLLGYKKYFAPSADILNQALFNATKLSVEQFKKYNEEPISDNTDAFIKKIIEKFNTFSLNK